MMQNQAMWNINLSKTNLNLGLQDASHSEIGTLLGLVGLDAEDAYAPPVPGRQGLSRAKRVKQATQNISNDDVEFIKKYAIRVLNQRANREEVPEWATEVVQDFRENGWNLERSKVPNDRPWSTDDQYKWEVNPLGHDETPLADLTTKIEALFCQHALDQEVGHYKQALKSFESQAWAAANAQLRTSLESTLVALAKRQQSWNGTKGGDAIAVLKSRGYLSDEESKYFSGLWNMSHSNGSHPGLSDEDEAQFRIYSVTAGLYYLVNRLK